MQTDGKDVKLDTDMGKHFCTPSHQGNDDIKIYILDFTKCHPQSLTAEQLRDKIEEISEKACMGGLSPHT